MPAKLFRNGEIYTPHDSGSPLRGPRQGLLNHFSRGAMLVEGGHIAAIGSEDDVLSRLAGGLAVEEVDCGGKCLIPGFVDPHTHMCFAALREAEFAQRLSGTPYLTILERGGGILSSVRAVAEADVEHLCRMTLKHMSRALACGTTTVEIKSGYGLDTAAELKMLEAIGRAAAQSPMDVIATFLGAHAIPPAYKERPDDFIDLVIEEMLPAVRRQGIAHQCDIFCEKGVFSIDQGRRLLRAAQKLGMKVKLHADEVNDLGGASLAAELGALSADHLLAAGEDNIAAMADRGVVATLLPATAYSLKKSYANARMMIERGVPVALATDCNPGSSYTESMVFVIGLAVMCMDMSPGEALTAATLNSAYAIDMADKVGSLDVGKQADFLVLDGKTPAMLAYHAGLPAIEAVYKKGEPAAGASGLKTGCEMEEEKL